MNLTRHLLYLHSCFSARWHFAMRPVFYRLQLINYLITIYIPISDVIHTKPSSGFDMANMFDLIGKWPNWPILLFYVFISILFMFRATSCPSSGASIVSIQHLVYITLCRWPSRMQVGKGLPDLSMYSYCCLCLCILLVVYVFLSLSMYTYCCLCILRRGYPDWGFSVLFPQL